MNTKNRNYVDVNDCDSAENVLKILSDWFMYYNQNAPHSALGMNSPVEYRLTINNWQLYLMSKAELIKYMPKN